MKINALVWILLLTILAPSAVTGQQLPAPSTSHAASASGDLATTMKTLEDKLRSVGRLNYMIGQSKKDPWFLEMTNLLTDPKECRVRIYTSTPLSPRVDDYYLEEITELKVEPFMDQFYRVRVSEWLNSGFYLRDRESAEQVAQLLALAAEDCRSNFQMHAHDNNSGPALTETLNFIADKLSSQGPVSWVDMSAQPPESYSYSYEYPVATPNPSACTISIQRSSRNGNSMLPVSFRRIEKIEVIPWGEAMSRWNDRDNHSWTSYRRENRITTSPPTFVLRITVLNHSWRDLVFADDTLADRVAKAINHAAELCGAGSKPEPF